MTRSAISNPFRLNARATTARVPGALEGAALLSEGLHAFDKLPDDPLGPRPTGARARREALRGDMRVGGGGGPRWRGLAGTRDGDERARETLYRWRHPHPRDRSPAQRGGATDLRGLHRADASSRRIDAAAPVRGTLMLPSGENDKRDPCPIRRKSKDG